MVCRHIRRLGRFLKGWCFKDFEGFNSGWVVGSEGGKGDLGSMKVVGKGGIGGGDWRGWSWLIGEWRKSGFDGMKMSAMLNI